MPSRNSKPSGKRQAKTNRPGEDEVPARTINEVQNPPRSINHTGDTSGGHPGGDSTVPATRTAVLSLEDPDLYRRSMDPWGPCPARLPTTVLLAPQAPQITKSPSILPSEILGTQKASVHTAVPSNPPASAPSVLQPLLIDQTSLHQLLAAAVQQGIEANEARVGRATLTPPTQVSSLPYLTPTIPAGEMAMEPVAQGPLLDNDPDALSEEENDPDEQHPSGLFPPSLFRSLLQRARALAGLPAESVPPPDAAATLDPIFSEFTPAVELIPAPPMFLDNIKDS